jgi:DNA polymerase IIIc chi subunit
MKAINIAEKHLSQEFTQKMVFKKIIAPLMGDTYYLYFYPKNNPELVFTVYVDYYPELGNPEDDYYIDYFSLEINKKLKKLFGKDAYVNINTTSGSMPDFTEQTTLSEMLASLEYYFIIVTKQQFDKSIDPAKILEMISFIQDSDYNPEYIEFGYSTYKKENIYFNFENWKEIQSMDEIIEYIDSKLNPIKADYYEDLFSLETSKKLKPDLQRIFGEDAFVITITTSGSTLDFTEQTTLSEMIDSLEYYFIILTEQQFDRSTDPEKILEMISFIQDSDYNPEYIRFRYYIYKKENICFDFENWKEIQSVDEVIEYIDNNWEN